MRIQGNLPLHSERLLLRPFMAMDAHLAGSILGDPKVVFWAKKPLPMKMVRACIRYSIRLNKKGLGWWLVFTKGAPQQLVGDVLLQPLRGTHEIELGYHFLREHWGCGYATEAVMRIVRHGFETAELARIRAVVLPRNHRSLRVVHKIGMTQNGSHLHGGLKHRYFTLKRHEYESKTAL